MMSKREVDLWETEECKKTETPSISKKFCHKKFIIKLKHHCDLLESKVQALFEY